MKTTLFLTASAIFSLAAAAPLRQNQKRDLILETAYEEVTETVAVTQTVFVDGVGHTLSISPASPTGPSDNNGQFFESPSFSRGYAAPSVVPSAAPSVAPAPVPTTAPTTTAAAVPTTSSTSSVSILAPAVVAPTTAPAPAPVVPSTTQAPPAPVVVPTSAPAPVVVPTTAPVVPPAPVYTPPSAPAYVAPTTTALAPVYTAPASSGGVCSDSGNPCKGDITFYDTGLGACGWDTVGEGAGGEMAVALPAGLMGAQSNGNPMCGKTITVNYGGKSIQAKVVDKCPGCSGNSIDLSKKAFEALADFSIGRTQATWHFN